MLSELMEAARVNQPPPDLGVPHYRVLSRFAELLGRTGLGT